MLEVVVADSMEEAAWVVAGSMAVGCPAAWAVVVFTAALVDLVEAACPVGWRASVVVVCRVEQVASVVAGQLD